MTLYFIDFDAYAELEASSEEEAKAIFIKKMASIEGITFPDIDIFDIKTEAKDFIEVRTLDRSVSEALVAEKEAVIIKTK